MTHAVRLPEGWETTSIGELAEVLRGVTYKKAQSLLEERSEFVPLLRATNIDRELAFSDFVYVPRDLVKDEQMLQPGDSVIAASSGSLSVVGKSAPLRHEWEGTFGAFCFALRPNLSAVVPLYLAHYLQTTEYRSTVSKLAAGVNINNLKRQHLEDMPILYAPSPEQQRIVEAIESYLTRLDAAVASLERVQKNLKRYRASVLKAAVEGRLVPTEAELAKKEGRSYEPASKLLAAMPANSRVRRGVPESVEIREYLRSSVVPDGWALVSVADLLRRGVLLDVKDGNHGTNHPHKNDFSDEGLPFITASQMGDFEIDYEGAPKIAGDPLEKLKVGFAQADDVILSHKGTVGRVAVCTKPCVLTPQTTYYRPNQQILLSSYLAIHHASPIYQMQLAANKSQTTRDFVPIRRQYTLFVLVPPIEEQRRIVTVVESHLSRLRFMQKTIDEAAKRILRLRQSILKWAFKGKLVEQDPNDEPASVLLERIKAERESMQPRKSRQTRKRKNVNTVKHDEQLDLLGGSNT